MNKFEDLRWVDDGSEDDPYVAADLKGMDEVMIGRMTANEHGDWEAWAFDFSAHASGHEDNISDAKKRAFKVFEAMVCKWTLIKH